MSDELTDRIILEHEQDEKSGASSASAAFFQDAVMIGEAPVKKMVFTPQMIAFTFTCVPSLAVMLATTEDVRCVLQAGHHLLDYNLRDTEVVWDNGEGKQDCTIISKIDKIRSKQ
jgi:hypothetical protein